jgi:hypothetical protein
MSDCSAGTALAFPGVVHGLGAESECAARTYAGMTGRTHRQYIGHHLNIPVACNDVVVCLTSQLAPELMYSSYVEGPTNGAPGFIFASTSELLEQSCLRIAARLTKGSIR